MATSNPETITLVEKEIYDGRKKLRLIELYVDNCRRAVVHENLHKSATFRFDSVGAFNLQEARVWLQGLLELSIRAEDLDRGKK